MNILVLNVGSSSLKFQLIDTDESRFSENADRRLARGQVERIGGEAVYSFRAGEGEAVKGTAPLRDHRAAVEFLLHWIVGDESGVPVGSLAEIGAAGHRVVHGGERFVRSVAIDDEVLRGIEETIELAPLHNPANLKGIQAVRATLGPAVPQVAVFDTAFHHTLPERAYLYAIPYSLYRRHRVRRYGFHGTSHRFVAYRYRQLTGRS
ncbi:MAG: acetate kinase, partial [Longimicrobiaceae bacterium]